VREHPKVIAVSGRGFSFVVLPADLRFMEGQGNDDTRPIVKQAHLKVNDLSNEVSSHRLLSVKTVAPKSFGMISIRTKVLLQPPAGDMLERGVTKHIHLTELNPADCASFPLNFETTLSC
jgi:hypothetical protein